MRVFWFKVLIALLTAIVAGGLFFRLGELNLCRDAGVCLPTKSKACDSENREQCGEGASD
jgi:hypothetical protein